MGTKTVTPPSVEPFTLAEAKLHLKVDNINGQTHPDDDLITSQISAAREFAEHYCGRAFTEQELEYATDAFPDCDELYVELGPIKTVGSIKYRDTSDVEQTLGAGVYFLDEYDNADRFLLAPDQRWPATGTRRNGVKVRYTTSADIVPDAVIAAMKLLIAHLYTLRAATITGTIVATIPLGVLDLLDTAKSYRGAL